MGENIHRSLAAVVIAIALTAFLGWRSLRGTESVRGAPPQSPLPSPQLTPLMPYTQPVADTALVPRAGRTAVLLARDPFGATAIAPSSQISHSAEGADVAPREAESLHVTATMIGGARRAAVINDMLVYVGDRVPGGGKLTSVERDRVVVTEPNGTSHVVAVKEGEN